MEWLRVEYPQVRDVFVDGTRWAATNEKFAVGSGPHAVHLGIPPGYQPPYWKGNVTGTTYTTPMVITFS
jgi:hypothetical protein